MSAKERLEIALAVLRRIRNGRNSITHRLPPEILALVASHLEDDKSLVIATHVCYFWRLAFLSSPRLWSHLTFKNERRALVFLERSKATPISVDLDRDAVPLESVKELLKGITKRLSSLRTSHVPFLDELLIQPLPVLRYLDVTSGSFPSIRSLAAANLDRLTVFYFTLCDCSDSAVSPEIGDDLLDFLRNSPALEVVFFGYDERGTEFTANEKSTEAVSLPCLRSFTHESPTKTIHIGLFNRLSLPPTCDVAFTITDFLPDNAEWSHGFPTLRGASYISDTKMVKITFQAQDDGYVVIKATFINSKHTRISFNRLTIPPQFSYLALEVKNILKYLGCSEVARTVEALHFEHCPILPQYEDVASSLLKLSCLKAIVIWQCDPEPFLETPSPPAVWCPHVEKLTVRPPGNPFEPTASEILERVRDIAVSRREHAIPLKTLTLISRDAERLSRACGRQIEELGGWVESVQVLQNGER